MHGNDDRDDNDNDAQGRKQAQGCSQTTRLSSRLDWPPGEIIIDNIIVVIISIIINMDWPPGEIVIIIIGNFIIIDNIISIINMKLDWPQGEIVNIIDVITFNIPISISILRKELAQIENQGQLGQLWWIPLSWCMNMIKG